MANNNLAFFDVFLEFLQSLYDSELRITKALGQMIQKASHEELKKNLNEHLKETKEQVKRLEKIFKLLGVRAENKTCSGIIGLLEEGDEILRRRGITSAVRDCFIIIAAQKVEHYEIAAYGSACTLIEHMNAACPELANFDEIYDLLKTTLHEEARADIKLTKVAEGKFFKQGINDELEQEITVKQ